MISQMAVQSASPSTRQSATRSRAASRSPCLGQYHSPAGNRTISSTSPLTPQRSYSQARAPHA